jgi:hypothetical protein
MAAAVSVWARTRTASVSSPFSSTQALNGDIDGPVWRMKLWMCSAMNASDDRMMPPRQRPWPSICFVAEYTTTSAPSVSGLCQIGVANTLSTISRAPPACAISAIPPMSSTSRVGLVGLSRKQVLVFGRIAFCHWSRSRPSTSVDEMP